MAGTNYTTATQRPSTNTSSPPSTKESDNPTRKNNIYTFTFSWPFNFPSTPESAALRIIKNIEKFKLYYTVFVWTVLFITLIPKRKVSVVYLVATTEVAFLYFLLLFTFKDSVLLHKIIDKRIVMFLLFVCVGVEMILTRAAVHFFVTLVATIPVVILHAVLCKRLDDDVLVPLPEESGEMVGFLNGEKLTDIQVENMV